MFSLWENIAESLLALLKGLDILCRWISNEDERLWLAVLNAFPASCMYSIYKLKGSGNI